MATANGYCNGTANGNAEPTATAEMCVYCFDALTTNFTGKAMLPPAFPQATCPLFVTWKRKSSSGELRLRGCIGTLEPRAIHKVIKDYALTSALHDRRFNPVKSNEVPSLHCTVSLLTHYEDAQNYLDWEVGKHGLLIEFFDNQAGCTRSATYLPEVAKQEGWSHEEAIESLMRKSGYGGPITKESKLSIKLVRYQSTTFSLTYDEYCTKVAQRGSANGHQPTFANGHA
mmetsp:Transcript_17217/g.37450  ORF Transcript_17217/g.37450 Transcript_17217/m.37450 type:complete len:229 (+) Transcript_17217:255-941(+)|eukprot:CAMPEP_0118935962 /NCGR_PEP_ID=MMETSP1169-20130426/15930_1 /TAXON_ID=36882 /ORGANISM="Pyramimonas obovata, Strain CCMP722" /LENGTH=228 /DNA_ID=CAMNT_0006879047 /DNA_START=255 /DNA_END=941 /DNA_ORIENTATION=-